MGNELIKDLVRFEEELRNHLAAEREGARRWLEEARRDLEGEFRQRRAILDSDSARALAAAAEDAQRQGDALVQRAEDRARKLEGLKEEVLEDLVRQHLPTILPGRVDDHPDVEG